MIVLRSCLTLLLLGVATALTADEFPTTSPTTSEPTAQPTTAEPTGTPTTAEPTISAEPTPLQTSEKDKYYFSFDPDDKDHGPNKWDKVKVSGSEYFDMTKRKSNMCDGRKQSPVNIRRESSCQDDHQIFMKRGNQDFDSNEFLIMPSSLRMNLKVKELEKSAAADTSNLATLMKAHFLDVKIPSEHTFEGKYYDGEIQITHHWDRKEGRFIILSILLDKDDDEENDALEVLIREWEEEAAQKKYKCDRKNKVPNLQKYERKHKEAGRKGYGSSKWNKIWGKYCGGRSCNNGAADWDVYRFVPTFWYCGYKGSLTIPPCTELVHWRIFDLPLKVGKDQIERMTDLLANQLDDNCNVKNIGYVDKKKRKHFNRPLQKKRQSVYCCDSDDFKVDIPDASHDYWEDMWPRKYHGRDGLK